MRNIEGVESPGAGPTGFMPVQAPVQWLDNMGNIGVTLIDILVVKPLDDLRGKERLEGCL